MMVVMGNKEFMESVEQEQVLVDVRLGRRCLSGGAERNLCETHKMAIKTVLSMGRSRFGQARCGLYCLAESGVGILRQPKADLSAFAGFGLYDAASVQLFSPGHHVCQAMPHRLSLQLGIETNAVVYNA